MRFNLTGRSILVGAVITLAACSAKYQSQLGSGTSSSTAAGAAVLGKITMSVQDTANNVIYSDAVSASSLQLVSGKSYKVNLAVANPISGATFQLQTTQTNVPSGSTTRIPLQLGVNSFTLPNNSQGDYAWMLVASVPGGAQSTKNYIASVQCATPVLTDKALNPSALTVTPTGTKNIFTFSAAGVVPSSGGPFQCAFDVTGTGIQDTAFADCGTAVNSYVNLINPDATGTRNIGVIVKDSCFTTVPVSKSVNMLAATPSMPGNVFIQGQVSNASGLGVVGDPRVDGVGYLATNAAGNNIVQPSYSNGVFTIKAFQNYGMPSSVKFGMTITISNITDSLNMSNGTGSISVANAKVQKVTFSTDQAGDSKPAISLTSSGTCTLSNQGAQAIPVSGQPCAGGSSGDQNGFTVEVWGQYSCPVVSASGASVTITGSFDGMTKNVDSCSGGGGGGGGIVPITL